MAFISGMTKYPSAGWYSTGAYLISGIPYVKTTGPLADNANEPISFGAITREVTVSCLVGKIVFHFADAAVGDPANAFTLHVGHSVTLPVRTKQITIRGADAGGNSQASVAATLTGIRDVAEYPKFDNVGGVT